MKDELYKKVYIHSVNDLPKEEDEYYVHKIGRGLDIFNWYGANFSSGWLEEIDWYLHPFPDQDLPSDEEIEEWAKTLCYNNEENPIQDGSIIRLRYESLIEGAKAMRDGKIKSNRK